MTWRRMTSRQRLTILLLIGLTLLFVVFGAITVRLAERELDERLDRDLTAVAINSASTLELVPAADYVALGSKTPVDDPTYTVGLVDPDGTPTLLGVEPGIGPSHAVDLSRAEVTRLRAQSGQPFTVDDFLGTGQRSRAVSVAMDNGHILVTARSLDEVDDSVASIARLLLFGYLVLLVALCLLVWFVSRQALRPLEDVIASADNVDYHSLGGRVIASSNARDVEHLTQALNGMLARIETSVAEKQDADRRLRQFVADASHELRTPLAAVLGYTELYETGIATRPDQVDKAMQRISIEGGRMQRLVDDLLTLARLDEGRPQQRSNVDLHHMVIEAIAAAQATDPEHGFILDDATGAASAFVDPDAIRQVLDNLLSNITNHTPAGTTATITVRQDEERAVIAISDDGPGMTQEDRDRAFDRFWRADAARARPGGSGLGLAIVDELIDANAGRIRLDESVSGGLLTEFDLPRRAGSDDRAVCPLGD